MTTLEWATVVATGPDAASFLDGQLSQSLADVGAVGGWTVVLDPDGTVVSIAWVRGASDAWTLAVPAARGDVTLARLQRFRLRVKVELALSGGVTEPPLTDTDDLFTQQWPWAEECERALVPHSFGTTFVNATVSFTKGCFTGQELVGRLDARGANVPWRFVRATGPDLATVAASLAAGPAGPQGVTRHRALGDGVEAFGIAHRSLLTNDTEDVSVEPVL